ncbi:MAG: hypothetical protein NTV72_02940 [Candidatus Taylorbacteria bacterium]|nr:hypothetical protein [Candidatus Taylorbacteria bacterium]
MKKIIVVSVVMAFIAMFSMFTVASSGAQTPEEIKAELGIKKAEVKPAPKPSVSQIEKSISDIKKEAKFGATLRKSEYFYRVVILSGNLTWSIARNDFTTKEKPKVVDQLETLSSVLKVTEEVFHGVVKDGSERMEKLSKETVPSGEPDRMVHLYCLKDASNAVVVNTSIAGAFTFCKSNTLAQIQKLKL